MYIGYGYIFKESNLFIVCSLVELYTNLQEVRSRIEHEHHRLSHLQTLLKADGNKVKL